MVHNPIRFKTEGKQRALAFIVKRIITRVFETCIPGSNPGESTGCVRVKDTTGGARQRRRDSRGQPFHEYVARLNKACLEATNERGLGVFRIE